MTTIVVPLDGSVFAERALRPACSIAARLEHARVVLVTLASGDVEAARVQLNDRAALFSEVVEVETRLLGTGDPVDAILATVASEPDALLCMATHGRSGIGAAVLGSIATQIVCRSTQPLVLVGPQCRTALLPTEHGRLVVCSDGSPSSDTIVPTAAVWCDRLRLEPWLVEVVPPDEYPQAEDEPARNQEVEAAQARLDQLSARLHPTTTGANTAVLHGTPSRSITRFAERLPAALIAMATHGRSGITRVTMGSIATEVVRNASCPVLISRPTDTDGSTDE